MAKRPAAKPTTKATKPADVPVAAGATHSLAEILAAWSSGRDALRLVAASVTSAQEALAKLGEDATDQVRAEANDALHLAREAVQDVIAGFNKLPDLPHASALLVAAPLVEAPAADAGGSVLGPDSNADPDTLTAVTVSGPADGRWRLGRRFTPEAQTLQVSAATLEKLKADPLLSVVADG